MKKNPAKEMYAEMLKDANMAALVGAAAMSPEARVAKTYQNEAAHTKRMDDLRAARAETGSKE